MQVLWNVLLTAGLLTIPPLLLARIFTRKAYTGLLLAAVLLPAFSLAIALLLHVGSIPINRTNLILSHGVLLAGSTLLACRFHVRVPAWPHIPRLWLLGAGLLLLMIFPWTRLTGVDTYKWQDLATAIQVEQSIPWLVHPIALLGFGPRAYPPLQPVLLATIQLVGDLGVDAGFRFLSVLNLLLGLSTAAACFQRVSPGRSGQMAAWLYVISPVFVRYTHWATGRGLFLALLPACLYCLAAAVPVHADRTPCTRSLRARFHPWLAFLFCAVLLLLSHKAALVAIPLLLCMRMLPIRLPASPLPRAAVLVPFALLAVCLAVPPGGSSLVMSAATILRTSLSRFSWFLPVALLTWWLRPATLDHRPGSFLPWLFLFSVPLAFEPNMYGALIALPAICMFAAAGVLFLWRGCPARYRRPLAWGTGLLTVLIPLAIIVHHSRNATPRDIKAAALFLEQYDPEGPYLVDAPGALRPRIQAYVSGCPRFTISRSDARPPAIGPIRPPPRLLPLNANTLTDWSAWLRQLFTMQGLDVAWYGDPARAYHVVTDQPPPANMHLIYTNASVRIYATHPSAPAVP